ncbi:hypothetical protein CXF67_13620 [Psychroflexus sp. MES1-P1E]|nr:hypothetical protein CXF67_13620 [Psychroflexus sp. MES1-P1E]
MYLYDIINLIWYKIPLERRKVVEEVTVDMENSMNLITKKCFSKTELVTDQFHVQK